ncbi:MAG: ABC transporter permease [Verrucomicrobiota bacterium]
MTGLSNWFSQLFSVSLFSLRSIPARKGSAISAAVGIAGVVAVLVGVLAIAEGFRKTMTSAATPGVAIVLRTGAENEMTSGITRDETRIISDAPEVARNAEGPLASAELFVIINLPKRSTGTDANVPLRGVQSAGFEVRGNVKMLQGRRFESGKNEIIVGAGAAREFSGLDLGSQLKIGQNTWEVVGIFSTDGGISDSEIWTDAAVLQPAYNRGTTFQSVYVKLKSDSDFQAFKDGLTKNPELKTKVKPLSEFYADQSEMLSGFITGFGVFISVMMAFGALFGALNTMYSAVSSRTREIATLRALGFSSMPVIFSVLAESLALSLFGGIIGAAGAYFAFDGYQAATMNFQTFSQVTFAFAVTPKLLVVAIITAAILGLLGGFFPAIRAARLPIASALRDS